ncbi:MAG: hypothetical protein K6A65_02095 [Succinivibrionaceae bacterium]|nr:hypothetical protein [Succinivibrionaceae bacterium]
MDASGPQHPPADHQAWWGRVSGAIIGFMAQGLLGAAIGFALGFLVDLIATHQKRLLGISLLAFSRAMGEGTEPESSRLLGAAFALLGHVGEGEASRARAQGLLSELRVTGALADEAMAAYGRGGAYGFDPAPCAQEALGLCRGNPGTLNSLALMLAECACAGSPPGGTGEGRFLRVGALLGLSEGALRRLLQRVRGRGGALAGRN